LVSFSTGRPGADGWIGYFANDKAPTQFAAQSLVKVAQGGSFRVNDMTCFQFGIVAAGNFSQQSGAQAYRLASNGTLLANGASSIKFFGNPATSSPWQVQVQDMNADGVLEFIALFPRYIQMGPASLLSIANPMFGPVALLSFPETCEMSMAIGDLDNDNGMVSTRRLSV
jgi:hypothetical protein